MLNYTLQIVLGGCFKTSKASRPTEKVMLKEETHFEANYKLPSHVNNKLYF